MFRRPAIGRSRPFWLPRYASSRLRGGQTGENAVTTICQPPELASGSRRRVTHDDLIQTISFNGVLIIAMVAVLH